MLLYLQLLGANDSVLLAWARWVMSFLHNGLNPDSTLDVTVKAAKNCSFNTEANLFAAALKTCINTFSKCRKYEDEAATIFASCSSKVEGLERKVELVFIINILLTALLPLRLHNSPIIKKR